MNFNISKMVYLGGMTVFIESPGTEKGLQRTVGSFTARVLLKAGVSTRYLSLPILQPGTASRCL